MMAWWDDDRVKMRRSALARKLLIVVVAALALLLVGSTVWVVATAHSAVALTGLAILSAVALDRVVKRFERDTQVLVHQGRALRPWMTRTATATTAKMSRMWIKPPSV
jgi:membrane protein implicated in regulation of membrane protease activity